MGFPERMKFGIFLGPFHRVGENPTLALDRDLELVQWLDYLGFDEAWIGEHHSAGWETISSPEIFMAVAADRTRYIKLGTGVISMPYHYPFMVANRMVQLDHMTHGWVMLGVGPGALPGDAYMMGIDLSTARIRMDESLGIVLRLFTETEPITYKSDWFELHEAMLQLRPFTKPHMPIAVASIQTPSGVALAGKYGASILSITVRRDPSAKVATDLSYLWEIAEESAAEHGKTVCRDDWRLVIPVHLAESRKEAFKEARLGAGRYLREYSEHTLGRISSDCPLEKIIDVMAENGSWIIGTPDDCIDGIKRLGETSGGFGGFLVQAIDWAPREKMLHSYELLARYVMPQFQGSTAGTSASNQWTYDRRETLLAARGHALDKAKETWATRRG